MARLEDFPFVEATQAKQANIDFETDSETWKALEPELRKYPKIAEHLDTPNNGDRSRHDFRLAALCIEHGIRDTSKLCEIVYHNPQGKAKGYAGDGKEYTALTVEKALQEAKPNKNPQTITKRKRPHYRKLRGRKMTEYPKNPEVIKPGIVKLKNWTVIIGFIGSGKTFLACELGFCMAKGVNWNNWIIERPWKVLYWDKELGPGDFYDRHKALWDTYKMADNPNFQYIEDATDYNLDDLLLAVDEDPDPPEVIIIDGYELYLDFGKTGYFNVEHEATKKINAYLNRHPDQAIILTHYPKASVSGRDTEKIFLNIQDVRGQIAQQAASAWGLINVDSQGGGYVYMLKCLKHRFSGGQVMEPIWLKIDSVTGRIHPAPEVQPKKMIRALFEVAPTTLFTRRDIQDQLGLPIGDAMMKRYLWQLRQEGFIEMNGQGKNSGYVRRVS